MNAKFKNKLFYLSIMLNIIFVCLIIIFVSKIRKSYSQPYRANTVKIDGNILKYIQHINGNFICIFCYNKNEILEYIKFFYDGYPVYSFSLTPDGNIKSKFIYYYDKQKLKMILLDKDNDGGFDKKLVKLSNGKIDLYINRNGKWEISKIQKGKDYKFLFNVGLPGAGTLSTTNL